MTWRPLFAFAVLSGALLLSWIVQSARSAVPAAIPDHPWPRWWSWALTTALHLLQPVARLVGRQGEGLTPWRRRGRARPSVRLRGRVERFTRNWRGADAHLQGLREILSRGGAVVRPGGPFDGWDLTVRGGLFGGTRVLLGLEEHGAGMQVARYRWWPVLWRPAALAVVVLAAVTAAATVAGETVAAWTLGCVATLVAGWALWEVSRSAGEVAIALGDDPAPASSERDHEQAYPHR